MCMLHATMVNWEDVLSVIPVPRPSCNSTLPSLRPAASPLYVHDSRPASLQLSLSLFSALFVSCPPSIYLSQSSFSPIHHIGLLTSLFVSEGEALLRKGHK